MYVGATCFDLEKRWKEHVCDSKRDRCCNRPLYHAMNLYGIDKFHISIIEECTEDVLYERERFWINKFNSFSDGYNATFGGVGKPEVDYQEVVDTYMEYQSEDMTAQILGIDQDTVRTALRDKNVKILSHGEVLRKRYQRGIIMKSLTGEVLKTFESSYEAASYIAEQYGAKAFHSAIRHIVEVCRGKRKTAYKYRWCFN